MSADGDENRKTTFAGCESATAVCLSTELFRGAAGNCACPGRTKAQHRCSPDVQFVSAGVYTQATGFGPAIVFCLSQASQRAVLHSPLLALTDTAG